MPKLTRYADGSRSRADRVSPDPTTTILHHVTRTVSPDQVGKCAEFHRRLGASVTDAAATRHIPAAHENVGVEPADEQPVEEEHEASTVDLRRAVWAVTTVAFLVAALILLLGRRYGYSEVTFAVAVAAAINLL